MKIVKILLCFLIAISNLNIGNDVTIIHISETVDIIEVAESEDLSTIERVIVVIKKVFYAFYRAIREMNIFNNRLQNKIEVAFTEL